MSHGGVRNGRYTLRGTRAVIVDYRTRERLLERGSGILFPLLWADAILAQEVRLAEAREALRQQKPFGPQTVEEMDLAGRLTWEAHFLLVATRQVLRHQEAYLDETGDRRLKDARAEFDKGVPNAARFRIILEHLDDYLRDEGHLQARERVATGQELITSWGHDTGRITLRFGDL